MPRVGVSPCGGCYHVGVRSTCPTCAGLLERLVISTDKLADLTGNLLALAGTPDFQKARRSIRDARKQLDAIREEMNRHKQSAHRGGGLTG